MAALAPVPSHSLTLYDHIQDLVALLEESELAGPELRPQYDDEIRGLVAGTKEKIDRTSAVLSQLEAVAQHASDEIDRLQKRKASALRNADRLKRYVLDVMAGAGMKKLEGFTSGFTMRCNAPSVDVLDMEQLPAAFVRIVETRAADKQAIKNAIAQGVDVPGVRLVQTLSLLRR